MLPDLSLHWTLTMTFPLLPGVCSPPARSPSPLPPPSLPPWLTQIPSPLGFACGISKYNQTRLPPLPPAPYSASSNVSVPKQSDLTHFYKTIQSAAPSTPSVPWDPKVFYVGMDAIFNFPQKTHIMIALQKQESGLFMFLNAADMFLIVSRTSDMTSYTHTQT